MYQKTTIVGRLTKDPVMRFTPDGKAVTDMRVAVNDYKDNTMWMKVAVWGKDAENCHEYLRKGALVLVEGSLDYDKDTGNPKTYVSKSDGQTHATFEMTAAYGGVKFLSSKGESQQEESSSPGLPWKH